MLQSTLTAQEIDKVSLSFHERQLWTDLSSFNALNSFQKLSKAWSYAMVTNSISELFHCMEKLYFFLSVETYLLPINSILWPRFLNIACVAETFLLTLYTMLLILQTLTPHPPPHGLWDKKSPQCFNFEL